MSSIKLIIFIVTSLPSVVKSLYDIYKFFDKDERPIVLAKMASVAEERKHVG
jgi:hypothetical protein